jgi:hypothetical protein
VLSGNLLAAKSSKVRNSHESTLIFRLLLIIQVFWFESAVRVCS